MIRRKSISVFIGELHQKWLGFSIVPRSRDLLLIQQLNKQHYYQARDRGTILKPMAEWMGLF